MYNLNPLRQILKGFELNCVALMIRGCLCVHGLFVRFFFGSTLVPKRLDFVVIASFGCFSFKYF